jgi:hypothetical protein
MTQELQSKFQALDSGNTPDCFASASSVESFDQPDFQLGREVFRMVNLCASYPDGEWLA